MFGLDKIWDFLSEDLPWLAGGIAIAWAGISWVKDKASGTSANHELPKEKPVLVSVNDHKDDAQPIDNGLKNMGKNKSVSSSPSL